MIKSIDTLVAALRQCPKASTLKLYKGYDWTKFVTEKYNSTFDIVKSPDWSLTFHRWYPDDVKRVEWWKYYEHSFMAIHHPLLVDDILMRKWEVRTIDFQTPVITASARPTMQSHNFSLHLFGRNIFPDASVNVENS